MGSGSASAIGAASTGSGVSMLIACPTFTAWFGFDSWPATRMNPSLISRWIWDRDRPGRTDARKRSSLTPSPSGGTVIVMLRRPLARGVRLRQWVAPQPDQHDDRQGRQDERDELRRREYADRSAWIAAIELDDEPGNRVQQHIEPERSAGKRA